ncbi:MAG: hypothetical protein US40_C0011G0045 [Candidatus Roizmanbacteria bacterium GW2011_GWC2_37_13]|uniref:Uncharacterized protein n=1 Tax=Candidatus Roizmanbacteria bacterium GW2011_GWC2_37_13 TaxID=1618486 RepID=A0A0G0GGI2_9BACT|nr:MAG: hypothetical protein US38_C0007G0045 [Candidatus Roizmanbacteria bacterium GW2011_GWC1_37_12]KKQ25160.1 MAG: hypothetical protein US40_C0011G0045 [Candidatus Roizmanbacteria bacterium GW2011_GWC2_37_13]
MSKEIVHSLILIAAIVLAFILPKTNLANYELQITAGLFIILYLVKKIVVRSSSSRLIESVIFTLIIVGIVNSTGATNSPFFFLVYFLLFSLSLLLEPIISITTTVSIIAFFLLSSPQGQDWKNLLPIISLAFITPFAMFLGEEHIESQKAKGKIQKLQEDSMLFITLLIKNHLKNIKEAVENFVGDHELDIIKKSASRMEKLIEKYEKS